jgi:bifunctional non-homologous end joining protein LigD
MALEEYRRKRDFRKTAEPPPVPGRPHRRPIFVVQEHHASHLHYDFRLEADGVLKSWAVPKGPSLDPAQKRLAVQVEDHPLVYASFEGTIPEGQYGAGTVRVWDHGTYETELAGEDFDKEMKAGRIEFTLYGERLKGRFLLLRMRGKKPRGGKEQWLLIKGRDRFAKSEGDDGEPAKRNPSPRSKRVARPSATSPDPDNLTFTHLDKLLFPDDGITKGDVLRYYERIADRLLPYLRDRPASLERFPQGVGAGAKAQFWQKDTPAYYPDWIPRVEIPTVGRVVRYAVINDMPTLLYLVNQNTLTFHVWFSRLADLDRPDVVLFDLDRGRADFAAVLDVAKHLHRVLEGQGVEAFVKTSGKTGLHILTPWEGQGGYDEARAWAKEIAGKVAAALPDLATTDIRKAKRGERVYVDMLQNARGKHVVPPYVLRAVPGAPVSTPLAWKELTPALDPRRFNLKTIFRRLSRDSDPWAELVLGRGECP